MVAASMDIGSPAYVALQEAEDARRLADLRAEPGSPAYRAMVAMLNPHGPGKAPKAPRTASGKVATGDARPCQVPGCANHVPATWAAWWGCCSGCWDKAMLARFSVKLKKDLAPEMLPEYTALNAAVRAGGYDWKNLIP